MGGPLSVLPTRSNVLPALCRLVASIREGLLGGATLTASHHKKRVCVVGSSTHFLSGISYYTVLLTEALASEVPTSTILMRRLIPRWCYPGRNRVGVKLTSLSASGHAPTFDGVDWYLVPSLFRALGFYRQHVADYVVLQWWTAAVIMPYLAIASLAKRMGARVIIEFHEDQDTGEASFPLARRIGQWALALLIVKADGFVAHSEWDRDRLCRKLGIPLERTWTVRHGPYSMVDVGERRPSRVPAADKSGLKLLFFGTIRPYKGLEHLVDAFNLLAAQREDVQLVVVGESWEGWTLPVEKIASSPYRDRINLVNRYVTDEKVRSYFEQADMVVLPYLRASASGPLHLAMAAGLPVVVTRVGGLKEAAQDYSGTVFCDREDARSLVDAIQVGEKLVGTAHRDSYSWKDSADAYLRFFELLDQLDHGAKDCAPLRVVPTSCRRSRGSRRNAIRKARA